MGSCRAYITVANISTYLTIVFGVSAAPSRSRSTGPCRCPWSSATPWTNSGAGAPRSTSPKRPSTTGQPGRRHRARKLPGATASAPRRTSVPASSKAGLKVSDLAVQYGGVRAVDGSASLPPWAGSPGWSGPTGPARPPPLTPCSGLLKPTAGQVIAARPRRDRDRPGRAQPLRARAHLPKGRTVQLVDRARERRARSRVLHGRGQPIDPTDRQPP